MQTLSASKGMNATQLMRFLQTSSGADRTCHAQLHQGTINKESGDRNSNHSNDDARFTGFTGSGVTNVVKEEHQKRGGGLVG
jgi:hypothetical protein